MKKVETGRFCTIGQTELERVLTSANIAKSKNFGGTSCMIGTDHYNLATRSDGTIIVDKNNRLDDYIIIEQ